MINPMGIKLLNKYIKNDWRDIADVCSFKKLKGKKICVDIYNYIYTFLGDNRLIEDLSKLCYIMYKNNIQCLFVFDGKYIEEKKFEYERRYKNRLAADKKYNKLIKIKTDTKKETLMLKKKLRKVNRDRVKLTKWDTVDAKNCLDACGMKYMIANGEAEELCAELVLKKKVYACMSEDTDLFAYGCTNIIKCINIRKETFIMYNIERLLDYYDITLNNFKNICSLSSNDYYKGKNNKHFIYYFKLYKRYLNDNRNSFMEWIKENNFITDDEFVCFGKNKQLYDLSNKNVLDGYKYIVIRNSKYDKKSVLKLVDMRNYYLSCH